MVSSIPFSGEQTIKSIRVSNFKSLGKERTIELGKITIFAGANSSGKSSFMQPLLLLKQTLDKPFATKGIDISGPNVAFSNSEQIFSRIGKSKKNALQTFSISFLIEGGDKVELVYSKPVVGGIDLAEAGLHSGNKILKFRPGEKLDEEFAEKFLESAFGISSSSRKSRRRILDKSPIELIFSSGRGLPAVILKTAETSRGVSLPIFDLIQTFAGNIIHVPGLRGNPSRSYLTSSVSEVRYPGLFNDYVAGVVHRWKIEHDENLGRVGKNLQELGLTWKVDTKQIDETRVEIKVARLSNAKRGGAHDMVSIADVGFGVSQVLPVVVALLIAKENQTVYIEQPEIHLHPRAQIGLAKLLHEASLRGVNVVVETLSGPLILAFQTLVAEGVILPEDIKLHWFTRDINGQTNIAIADISKDGSYGECPVDFDDVDMSLQQRYLDAIESQLDA